jgi:hypothetical protein
MREILEQKLELYKSLTFKSKEYNAWLKDSSLWMSVYSCLRVRGVEMDKRELVDIIRGAISLEIPIDIYNFVHNYHDVYRDMTACIEMQQSIDTPLLMRFYAILFEREGFRTNNPVIYKWGYIAPHFNEIGEKMTAYYRTLAHIDDPVDKAVYAHNGLAEIYPFGEDSAAMAMLAMYYVLLSADIPLPAITADGEEYDRIMKADLENHGGEFKQMIERSLINRLESVISLGIESENI